MPRLRLAEKSARIPEWDLIGQEAHRRESGRGKQPRDRRRRELMEVQRRLGVRPDPGQGSQDPPMEARDPAVQVRRAQIERPAGLERPVEAAHRIEWSWEMLEHVPQGDGVERLGPEALHDVIDAAVLHGQAALDPREDGQVLRQLDAVHRPAASLGSVEIVAGGAADVEQPGARIRRRTGDRRQKLAPFSLPARVARRPSQACELIPGGGRIPLHNLVAARHRIHPHEAAAVTYLEPPSVLREQVMRFAATAEVAPRLHPCVLPIVLVILYTESGLDQPLDQPRALPEGTRLGRRSREMTETEAGVLVLRPEVVATVIEDGAVLLNLETNDFYEVNTTGWAILQLFEGGAQRDQVMQRCQQWGAPVKDPAVAKFVDVLVSDALVVRSEWPASDAEVTLATAWSAPMRSRAGEMRERERLQVKLSIYVSWNILFINLRFNFLHIITSRK